jgi:hypothetical protein
MTTIQVNGTAPQLPPVTTKAVTNFNDAIRDALLGLHNGRLDCPIVNLEKASRLAVEVRNPHARELANLAAALASSFDTVQLVEMCLLDLFPEQ